MSMKPTKPSKKAIARRGKRPPQNTRGSRPARVERGRFAPGVSGNPGGRPAVASAIRDLAREHSEKAIHVLVAILDHADPRARIAAARELLDRGYGKAVQYSEVDLDAKVSKGGISAEEVEAMLSSISAEGADVGPGPSKFSYRRSA